MRHRHCGPLCVYDKTIAHRVHHFPRESGFWRNLERAKSRHHVVDLILRERLRVALDDQNFCATHLRDARGRTLGYHRDLA